MNEKDYALDTAQKLENLEAKLESCEPADNHSLEMSSKTESFSSLKL